MQELNNGSEGFSIATNKSLNRIYAKSGTLSSSFQEPFWRRLDKHASAVALIDSVLSRAYSYEQIAETSFKIVRALSSHPKTLILLPLDNNISDVIFYLGALASHHAISIYNASPETSKVREFIRVYEPGFVRAPRPDIVSGMNYEPIEIPGGHVLKRLNPIERSIHPSLKILLSTSGSTGIEKSVRLSASNLDINAQQISIALNIESADRAVTSLPLTYVYGLSVLHSHLNSGASILVDSRSILDERQWNHLEAMQVTSVPCIPWILRMLRTTKKDGLKASSIRNLTTSGNRLDDATKAWIKECLACKGINFYSMYGQTEAGGRMTVLPPELFFKKPDSVGLPVIGSTIYCDCDENITYEGGNVMLGYARCSRDLELGDNQKALLQTGDIGHLDTDGCLYLTGRKSRICKILGKRVSLDEIERYLEKIGIQVSVSRNEDESIQIDYLKDTIDLPAVTARELARSFNIPQSAVIFNSVISLQRSQKGKLP